MRERRRSFGLGRGLRCAQDGLLGFLNLAGRKRSPGFPTVPIALRIVFSIVLNCSCLFLHRRIF